MEPDCWAINFDKRIPEDQYDSLIEEAHRVCPPGIVIIEGDATHYQIKYLGGGKTGAHIKRRAAKNNPAEWVKYVRFKTDPLWDPCNTCVSKGKGCIPDSYPGCSDYIERGF
jgi:hypothetical protein